MIIRYNSPICIFSVLLEELFRSCEGLREFSVKFGDAYLVENHPIPLLINCKLALSPSPKLTLPLYNSVCAQQS